MDLMDQQGKKEKVESKSQRSQGQPKAGAMENQRKKLIFSFSFLPWPLLVRNWMLGLVTPNVLQLLCDLGLVATSLSGASFRIRRIVSRALFSSFFWSMLLHTYCTYLTSYNPSITS